MARVVIHNQHYIALEFPLLKKMPEESLYGNVVSSSVDVIAQFVSLIANYTQHRQVVALRWCQPHFKLLTLHHPDLASMMPEIQGGFIKVENFRTWTNFFNKTYDKALLLLKSHLVWVSRSYDILWHSILYSMPFVKLAESPWWSLHSEFLRNQLATLGQAQGSPFKKRCLIQQVVRVLFEQRFRCFLSGSHDNGGVVDLVQLNDFRDYSCVETNLFRNPLHWVLKFVHGSQLPKSKSTNFKFLSIRRLRSNTFTKHFSLLDGLALLIFRNYIF